MGVVGVDVGQQGAHHRRHPGAHVLRRQAGKVAVCSGTGLKKGRESREDRQQERDWLEQTVLNKHRAAVSLS